MAERDADSDRSRNLAAAVFRLENSPSVASVCWKPRRSRL